MRQYSGHKRHKVCIITSAHPAFDTRVFHKEARSLVKAGYNVILIVQHSKSETVDGVKLVGLPKPKNRFFRMFGTTLSIFKLAMSEKANVYHFHDPELIPIGILIKVFTKAKVIYDIHEDAPKQIQTKEWLPFCLRAFISKVVSLLENISLVFVDEIIVAGEDIAEHLTYSNKVAVVRNFPQLEMVQTNKKKVLNSKDPTVLVYAGSLTRDRGIKEMVEMIDYVKENVELLIVGSFNDSCLEMEIKRKANKKVKFMGRVPYNQVFQYLAKANIGLILLHPIPNSITAINRNNKIFEYMAVGLPIITSNFPAWKKIIENGGYGITVDPLNPKEISQAVEYLIKHPEEAKKMGENGQNAVIEKYNWESEEKTLIEIYRNLIKI